MIDCQTVTEADAKDFVSHRVHLGLGDFTPGATAHLNLSFEPLSAESMPSLICQHTHTHLCRVE
jgi:hypothetical protein